MKFRCERDVARRGARHRGTCSRRSRRRAARCCPACASSSSGTSLELTGTDLELTMRVRRKWPATSDGVTVLPARLTPTSCARSNPVRSTSSAPVKRCASRPVARSSACAPSRPTSSRACPSPPSTRSSLDAEGFAEALRQVVRAASTDEARPILTGVLMTAEERRAAARRDRHVPPGGARPARHDTCSPRARRCWCRRGRSTSWSGARRRRARSRCDSVSATRRSRWATCASPRA